MVERDGGVAELKEGAIAGSGECDGLHSAVGLVAGSRNQAGGLYAVEVMYQGRSGNADPFGDSALGASGAGLDGEQDQPCRPGSACLRQGGVEGPVDLLADPGDEHPGRRWPWRAGIAQYLDRIHVKAPSAARWRRRWGGWPGRSGVVRHADTYPHTAIVDI